MGFKGGAGALDKVVEFWRLPPADSARDERGEYTVQPVRDFCLRGAVEAVNPSRRAEFPLSEKRHAETEMIVRTRWSRRINPVTVNATHEIRYTEPGSCPAIVRRLDIMRCDVIGRMEELNFEVSEIR